MVENLQNLGRYKKTSSLERKLGNKFAKLSIKGDAHEN
jgi:hypothetical protein